MSGPEDHNSAAPPRRRRPEWASLVAGAVFVLLGVAFVLQGAGTWEFGVPCLLSALAVGLALVGAVRWAQRRRRSREQHHGVDSAED